MKKRSALDRATGFLLSRREECIADGRERMDTVRELAADAGVGVVSMSQAVSDLCSQGLLSARRGRGIFIPSGIARQTRSSPRVRSQVEVVRVAIQNDIIRGHVRRNERLPSSKELCERYGVCYRTLKQGLDALCANGELQRYRKGYRPVPLSRRGGASTLVLIATADKDGNVIQHSERTHDLLHTLESECSRQALSIETLPANMQLRDHPEDVTQLARNIGADRILGFVVLASGMPVEFLSDIVTRLRIFGRPFSLYKETVETTLPATLQSVPGLVTVTHPGSRAIGEKMGNHLVEQGHRRIAFISPTLRYDWAQGRLAGLVKAFRRAGYPNGVAAFQKDRNINPVSLASTPGLPESMQTRAAFWRRASRTKTLRTMANWVLSREVLQKDMAALMKQAARDEEITAWVGANDSAAIECLEFLKKSNLSSSISVVGFDNSLEGSMQGLTSYDFNSYETVNAMISHVLEAPRRRGKPRVSRTVVIDGAINERRSTRGGRTVR